MFSSIGWVEILVVIVLGIIIVGPERLPSVIQDVRAAIFAARRAIRNAKAELNGELSSFGAEFEDLRGPISQAAEWGRLGPRGALTKALFDGDDSAWDDYNPKKLFDAPANHPDAKPGQAGLPAATPAAGSASAPAQGGANAAATGPVPPPAAQPASAQAPSFDYSQLYSQPSQAPALDELALPADASPATPSHTAPSPSAPSPSTPTASPKNHASGADHPNPGGSAAGGQPSATEFSFSEIT